MACKNVLIFAAYMNWGKNTITLARSINKRGINVGSISWGEHSKKLIQNESDLFSFHDSHENFLKKLNEQDLNYTELIEKAKKWESKLGNLNKYIFSDRFLCNIFHEDSYSKMPLSDKLRLAYVVFWADFIEKIIIDNNIYSIISYTSSSAPMLLSADIIKLYNGNYTQLVPTRIPDRLAFCDGYDEENLIKLDTPFSEKKLQNELNNISKVTAPTWAAFDYRPTSFFKLFNKFKTIFAKKSSNHQKINSPFYFDLPLDMRIKNYFIKSYNNYFKFEYDKFIPDQTYFVYFLHVVPESAVSVHAQYYEDEFSIIANIVRSLPVGIHLYIKDHPHMQWKRDRSLYKKIQQMPSVSFIKPDEQIDRLIENSSLCITKTGTLALQAFWAGKPAIVFGDTFYNRAVGIYRFNKPMPELCSFISSLLGINIQEKNKIEFMEFLLRNSIDISSNRFLGKDLLTEIDSEKIVIGLCNANRI